MKNAVLNMPANIRIAFIGDVVGQPGKEMFKKYSTLLKKERSIDAMIVNGENSVSNGRGISAEGAEFLKAAGAEVITSGNHIWGSKDVVPYLHQTKTLIRPNNFPSGCPGKGFTFFECKGYTIGVLNLQGRVFMRELLDCPFRSADTALLYMRSKASIILVDFHAEVTAEKMAMGFYLDGRVSAVVGTHTHIQTADQRILPHGTAYMTDLGMTGALNSMIGMQKEAPIQNFITQMPHRFAVDDQPPFVMSGCIVDIEPSSGKAVNIELIRVIEPLHLV